MDIVDTFNHLIPTEHLDDALFLGSNLENEVCEDFSTSQNVLEDSLKNMLSDKDPMLGSASAQFCLPVLDSTDPNFQMPCSTAVGLDDIMDDRVKETAHSTTDEGDLSSNRKLRDQMDGTSTKSPRKSPRLMTQEPIRSLRQSTLAKRSNASSSVTTKKSSVKSGPVQKGGLKQHDKGQAKQDNNNAQEHLKKIDPSSNDSSQLEETKEIPSSSSGNSEWVASCAKSESTEADNEREIPSQAKTKVSHEIGSPSHLSDSITLCKEMENGAKAVTENYGPTVGTESASSTFVEADKVPGNSLVKNEGDEVNKYTSEISSAEKTNHKTEEEQNTTEIEDKSKEIGMSDTLLISKMCENSSAIEENIVQSHFVDGKAECNLGLKASGDIAHNASLQKEDKQECLDNLKKANLKDDLPLNSMEFEHTDLKDDGTTSIKLEANTLEGSIIQDIPTQAVYQDTESVKMGELEISGLQEDGHSNVPLKFLKKTKLKHIKTKQNKTIVAQQKLATIDQDPHCKIQVVPGIRSQSSVSLKRHIEEQGNIQHCQKTVKVKKQHSDKDVKSQSSDSGIPLKKPIHEEGKIIPRGQIPAQVRKMMAERMSDRSVSHHASSKEGSPLMLGTVNSKQGLTMPQHSQKQSQKHQLKTNNFIKEEGGKKDSMGLFVDSLKDDEKEKLKLRKLEKNLQPRQRRSSKSLSFDEPPLFIPDNISTIKRESSELLSPSESKSVWVPNKQCGFCRKPHGNSSISTPALQHG